MTATVVSEREFRERMRDLLSDAALSAVGSVTGPGRSGAVASVYASHILGVPFLPYGRRAPAHLGRLLIIDTARESGATLRKAERKYLGCTPLVLAAYEEPPRVVFWYEARKPQHYRHEGNAMTTCRALPDRHGVMRCTACRVSWDRDDVAACPLQAPPIAPEQAPLRAGFVSGLPHDDFSFLL